MATKDLSHALPYAQSLLELAKERKQVDEAGRELSELTELVAGNPTFQLFLSDPSIGHEERAGVFERVLRSQVSPLMWSFLGVLNVKGRLNLLPDIADAYDELLDTLYGKVEVDVTVAHALSAEDLEHVRAKVSKALGKDAVIHQYIDDSIIGGLVLRMQDQLIDGSVRSQLQAMRERLMAARPK